MFINYYLRFFNMVTILTELFTNNIFWSIVVASVLSQLVKILMFIFKFKQKFRFNDLTVTGGMPSTHSALVGSLTTIILLTQGLSALFFAVFTFSLIVLRDTVGVRRSVGEEGKVIEKIIKFEKLEINDFYYSLGHKFTEMVVGLILGIISAIFVYFL